ncbi:hypothetical protein [Vibrio sp. 10N]|uniref:hypothetical protein n=1 Tax=Vibrio sp. 10N TaxID=3058938 RepID=UPI0028130BE5|nr:hypothetical protein VB10N_12140 [Vibrio sp. 10N]
MYKYVKDKLDYHYSQTVPNDHILGEHEIPEEEVEIREMIEAWYVSGYKPLFGKDAAFEQSCCSHSLANIAGNWELQSKQQKTVRLQQLEKTLVKICRHRVYFAALTRFLSGFQTSEVKRRLSVLLLEAESLHSKPKHH